MSSTSVVAAIGHATSTPQGSAIDVFNFDGGRCRTCRQHPQGSRRQRLQLRWWPLSDLPPAPPKGPAIDVLNFGGGRCRTCRQHPPGGPLSTSSMSVVAAVGPTASTPQGARRRLPSQEGRPSSRGTCGGSGTPLSGRQSPEPWDMCQHRTSPQHGGEVRGREKRGSVGAHLSMEKRFRATGHVIAPELTSACRRGLWP
jgi:hypothetical protein